MTTTPFGIADFDDGFLNAGISASDVSLTIAPVYKYPSGVKTKQGFDSTSAIAVITDGQKKERVLLSSRSYSATTNITTYTVARGLSQTATTANYTAGTGLPWARGARIYVPVDNGNL